MMSVKVTLIVAAIVSIAGCSTMDSPQVGSFPYAHIAPITETLSLNADSAHLAHSQQVLAQFMDEKGAKMHNQEVVFKVFSQEGKALESYAKQYLSSAAVANDKIQWVNLSNQFNPLQRFDFSISVTEYQVQVPKCPASQVGSYYEAGDGCFIESALIQSMVNPEAMLKKAPSKRTTNR